MAFFTHSDVKRYGPQRAADEANRLALVKGPVKGEAYAAFTAKIIAEVALVAGDFSFTASGEDLIFTVAGENGLDPSQTAAAGDDLTLCLYSTVTQKVYICQDAQNRVITNETGDTVNIPNMSYTIKELAQTP